MDWDMCNPRRVRVRATRHIQQAWEQEIRRRATRTGQAVGEARIREPLGATVGAPALVALSSVLAAAPGWELRDDTFRHEIDGGLVVYHPATRELEIIATVVGVVEAAGEASVTVRGEVADTVEAEGVGVFYDDNWGGITEEDAERAAQQDAESALDDAGVRRVQQARQAADDLEGTAVQAQADERASAALTEATAARAEELRREAAARLTAVGIHGRNVFHQALAAAYRDAILAYARSRSADRISCTDRDGVIEIEFELQA